MFFVGCTTAAQLRDVRCRHYRRLAVYVEPVSGSKTWAGGGMWRITIRLLSNTHTTLNSRALRQPPNPNTVCAQELSSLVSFSRQQLDFLGPVSRVCKQELDSWVPNSRACRQELDSWVPSSRVCRQQLDSFFAESRVCVRQIHSLVPDFRAYRQKLPSSAEKSRVCRQFPCLVANSRVFRQQVHSLLPDSRGFCGRHLPSLVHRVCRLKIPFLVSNSRSCRHTTTLVPNSKFHRQVQNSKVCAETSSVVQGTRASRADSRVQLHSAALELPFEQRPAPEAALLHLQFREESSSPPPITDVHGTLNTVLWGIPLIANQMCSKAPEGHNVSEDLLQAFGAQSTCLEPLPIPQLTEFLRNSFVGFNSSAAPASVLIESPAVQSIEEQSARTFRPEPLSKETQSAKMNTSEAPSTETPPQESLKSRHIRLMRRQMKIESEAWQRATQEYKNTLEEMCKNQLAPNLPFMKSMFLSWFEPLTNAISAEQEAYRKGEPWQNRSCYGPYLALLPADKLAVITMHKTVAKLLTEDANGGLRVVVPVLSIGEAVEQEVRLQQILKKKSRRKGKQEAGPDDAAAKVQLAKHKALQKQVQKFIKQKKLRVLRKKIREAESSEPWSRIVQAQVGCRLLELLIETAYIQDPGDHPSDGSVEVRPAFRHAIRTFIGKESGIKQGYSKKYGVIECDSYISKGIHKMARGVVTPYMPMLVKPLPWQGYRRGGHLVLPTCIMRTHGAKELGETLKNTPKRQLQAVFEALDTLGSTKWRINTRVLEVVEKVWEGGGRIADLVDRDDLPEPEKPVTDDTELLKKWRWEKLKVKRINRELHSQRCDIELKLSVARQMKNEECFYYPHNIDFRGRAYPMHPHLNHLGSDMCRGLLEFAEGRSLRRTGLHWLKIHLANVYGNGVDKLSFDGRTAFVEESMENVLDSARRPLEGGRWWLAAEDPFQCLATCMEVSSAMSSSNPEKFMSHLPVHQDGSCNGLQHYAALGRDVLGAESVNLTAQEKPADVYTDIAIRVKGSLEKDFLNETSSELARLLHSQVDRKLVKQTVMTSVYGVTYVGARDQIMNRLQERHTVVDDNQAFNVSCYAAKTTLAALGEMFKAARIIMVWLGDCAKVIASHNQPVKWKTPLGLPVVQPYRKPHKIMVRTSLQNLALAHSNDTRVLVRRQRTAFPPNFVHSLDSTHMMMTAIACKKAGLTFAGVHDSFWTHAGDVDKMNVILRDKFVELYNQPILENLLKNFQENFPDVKFPPVPDRGDFDLQQVLHAPYFFN